MGAEQGPTPVLSLNRAGGAPACAPRARGRRARASPYGSARVPLPTSAKTVIKILQKHGFILSRQKGSHMIFIHPASGVMVPVPLHGGNKPIPLGHSWP